MAHGLRRIRKKPGRIRHPVHGGIAGGSNKPRPAVRTGNLEGTVITFLNSALSNSDMDVTFTIGLSDGTVVSDTANLLAADTDDGRATKAATTVGALTGVDCVASTNTITITGTTTLTVISLTVSHAYPSGFAPLAAMAMGEEMTLSVEVAPKKTKAKTKTKAKKKDS